MKQLRLKDPVIRELDHSVLIEIKHERLASPEDTVMQYLENNVAITNRDARGITGIKSENSMKSVFLKLCDRGLIEPVPGKSGFASAWQKKSKHGRNNGG